MMELVDKIFESAIHHPLRSIIVLSAMLATLVGFALKNEAEARAECEAAGGTLIIMRNNTKACLDVNRIPLGDE